VAIRLRDTGFDDYVIGVALEIDPHQVPMLLQIADSKLANLMALDLNGYSQADRVDRPHVPDIRQLTAERGSP